MATWLAAGCGGGEGATVGERGEAGGAPPSGSAPPAGPPKLELVRSARLDAVDKVDLLIVIDNSAAMADLQHVLAKAVPDLVGRLIAPLCVTTDASGKVTPTDQQPASLTDPCPTGSAREFNAINDIHIGVLSSSLGGHGSDRCLDVAPDAPGQTNQSNFTRNDHAHLVDRGARKDPTQVVFPKAQTWNDAGFFAWDPQGTSHEPPGEANAKHLQDSFIDVVIGADQIGCDAPSPMEAWYRFLVEPNPPARVLPPGKVGQPAVLEGTDLALLEQRAAFLRPDSLLAVVVLSDQNDCSVIDGTLPKDVCDQPEIDPGTGLATGCQTTRVGWPAGYVEGNFSQIVTSADGRVTGEPFPANYLVLQQQADGQPLHLLPGTAACHDDPSSPQCRSCYLDPSAPGCEQPLADDAPRLRCWNPRQRLGWDPFYPLQRYIDGLTLARVYDRDGFLIANPLYDDLPYEKAARAGAPLARNKLPPRDPRRVVFVPVVGVPWQDIARDPHDPQQGYLPTTHAGDEHAAAIDWDLVLGDPFFRDADPAARGRAPIDPLMIERPEARSGQHPVTGELIDASSWNHIGGHERDTGGLDLQYACILPLTTLKDCSGGGTSCDCGKGAQGEHNPLCEAPSDPKNPASEGTGVSTTTQYRAKAYPGTRFLQVAKGAGAQAGVGSLCAWNLTDPNAPDFGFRPALAPVTDRLKAEITGLCLSLPLPLDEGGSPRCVVVEARFAPDEEATDAEVAACRECAEPGLEPLDAPAHPDLVSRLPPEVSANRCLCAIRPATPEACLSAEPAPTSERGWCYADPSLSSGPAHDAASMLVARCPSNEKRAVSIRGDGPAKQALFVLCERP